MSEKPRIIFVDDERRVLNAMRALFRRDYELFLTTDGNEAIRLAEENDIHVLVADQRMPGMTGVEVLEQVKTRAPGTVRILLTGYADLDAIEASINGGEVFRFLSKPCPPNELRATLQQAVAMARATAAAAAEAIAEAEAAAVEAEAAAAAAEAAAAAVKEAEIASSSDKLPVVEESPESPEPSSATIVQFPSTGETGNNAIISSDDDTDINEVILAGDTITTSDTSTALRAESINVGVAVYTVDPAFAETAARTLQARHDVSVATNLIAVTKILEQQRAGVLLTDLTENAAVLRSMIGTLKQRLPELVAIVASENRDASEMISLINHGQVFRYIRKPLDTQSLQTDVNAALLHHRQLLRHPELIQRYAIAETAEPKPRTPKLIQFVDHLNKIGRPWRSSGS